MKLNIPDEKLIKLDEHMIDCLYLLMRTHVFYEMITAFEPKIIRPLFFQRLLLLTLSLEITIKKKSLFLGRS